MPGLVHVLGLVRPHLDAPGVRAHARHLLGMEPITALEFEAGGVAARVAAPFATLLAGLHLSRAHDHEVALADRDPLRLGAGVEVIVGNAFAILEAVDALVARNIEHNTTAEQLAAD